MTLLTIGILFGIYLLVSAVLEIIDAIVGEPGGRTMSAILGVVSVTMLVRGVVAIMVGFKLRGAQDEHVGRRPAVA